MVHNEANKLGQGGYGTVYKGVLPDVREIAVKRLYMNKHKTTDFYTEVNIVSGLENKNLVRFLGCNCSDSESILVYEFLPNKSLDHFIFYPNKGKTLNWEKRYQIVTDESDPLLVFKLPIIKESSIQGITIKRGLTTEKKMRRKMDGWNIMLVCDGVFDLVPATSNDSIHGNHKCICLVENMNTKEEGNSSIISPCFRDVPPHVVGGFVLIEDTCTLPFAPRDSHEANMQPALEGKVSELVDMLDTCRHLLDMLSLDPVLRFRFSIPFTAYNATYFLFHPLMGRYFDATPLVIEAVTLTIYTTITKDVGCEVASLEMGVVHVIFFHKEQRNQWLAVL